MSRSIGLAFVMTVAVAGRLAAQTPQEAPKEHSMTGCLTKIPEPALPFRLDKVEGNGPKSVGIVASMMNMAWYQGQKIQITGTAIPVKDAEQMEPAPPKAPHYMNVTAVKVIAKTCK